MTTLPLDIERKINQLFIDVKDNQEVKDLIIGLWTSKMNVESGQLARSILTISDNDIQKLKSIFIDFYGDPRDVIMTAERKLGNPGHYFLKTFDEIENRK